MKVMYELINERKWWINEERNQWINKWKEDELMNERNKWYNEWNEWRALKLN